MHETKTSSISINKLLGYFFPELVTAALLYIGLEIIDYSMIACTNVASCNATLVISNSLFHLITKVAEGFQVAMVIMCGQYNGAHEYHKTGRVLSDALWTTALVGGIISLVVFLSPHAIFAFYEVPQEIVDLGVPFMRIRAVGIFFSFVYLALIGFLRGIKNTKAPMFLFMLGAVVFLFFDYALIFGKFGFPALGIRGSAIATVAQYGIMLAGALIYILKDPEHRKYGITLFTPISIRTMRDFVHLSWPVMIDKASIAIYPIWLAKMMAITVKTASLTTGRVLFDSYSVLRVMERVGILPAVAFAQVITFLVSNDYKISHFSVIKKNIKKVLILAACFVSFFTALFIFYPHFFLALLNKRNAYNDYISHSLWYIALLIFFDVLQLILSASLRGAADVKTVMWARLVATGLFFVPVAYIISMLPMENILMKFILLYSSVHFSYALMGAIYVMRFKSGEWKRQSIKA